MKNHTTQVTYFNEVAEIPMIVRAPATRVRGRWAAHAGYQLNASDKEEGTSVNGLLAQPWTGN